MVLSGTLNDGFYFFSTRTITASVAGTACSGASTSVNGFSNSFSSLQIPASCGSGAVTLFVNGVAAGLQTSSGATCLAFAAGTTVDGLTVTPGTAQDTSCVTGSTAAQPASAAGPRASSLVIDHMGTTILAE